MAEETVSEQEVKQEPSVQPSETTPEAPKAEEKSLEQKLLEKLDAIQARQDEFDKRLSGSNPFTVQQPQAAPVAQDPLDSEIETRKAQLGMIERGELDRQYLPAVHEALNKAQIQKEGRQIAAQMESKNNFIGQWNQGLQMAHEEFPELKDTNSELYKETKKLIESNKTYPLYAKAINSTGFDKASFEALDPYINLRAAREAYAILERKNLNKPKITNPSLAKAALEGRGSQTPLPNTLTQLKEKAVSSGDLGDWRRYQVALDQSKKARTA